MAFSDLIKIPTKDEFVTTFVSLFKLGGFPIASWHSGSLHKHTVETESSIFVDLSTSIQSIAKAGLIKLAGEVADEWVDLCAENVFDEERKGAVYTKGSVTITDAEGVGPVDISAGSFWIANADGSLRFVNLAAATVPLNGSVAVTFQAETAGAAWNVSNGALTEALTPIPGLEVSNPALADTGTWITQQGTDKETNAELADRCINKWATLGTGSNDDAYLYNTKSVAAEITRAKVYSPGGGSVRVVVAGASGPVSASALALAVEIVERKRPIGVPDVLTSNAIARTDVVAATLTVSAGKDPASALAAAQASVNALARSSTIGGKVSRERVIKALLVDGLVEDCDLPSFVDLSLGLTEVWVPTYALTVA